MIVQDIKSHTNKVIYELSEPEVKRIILDRLQLKEVDECTIDFNITDAGQCIITLTQTLCNVKNKIVAEVN